MKTKLAEAEKCFGDINKYSKFLMKFGTFVIFVVYFAAMCCAAFAGRGADYGQCMFYFDELTLLGKELFGMFYVFPLMIDIFVRAEKFDRQK